MKNLHLIAFLFLFLITISASGDEIPELTLYGQCHANVDKCNDIYIVNNIAFVGCFEAGLLILDISDPVHPEFVSCYYLERLIWKIYVKDELVFISHHILNSTISETFVTILDITDLYHPQLINSFETEYDSENLSIDLKDDYLFLSMSSGLCIYDIADLNNPEFLINLPDIKPTDMIITDNLVFFTQSRYFGILDITQILDPELLCWIGDYDHTKGSIDKINDLVYVSGSHLEIYNVQDPTEPVLLSEYSFSPTWARDMKVQNEKSYIITYDDLRIIDVTDPFNPQLAGIYEYIGDAICISDSIVAVSIGYDYSYLGVGLFNIENPQNIILKSEYITSKAQSVYKFNQYAYIANGYSGLKIIDMGDPYHPVCVSECLQGILIKKVIVYLDYAYVHAGVGLIVLDISDPEFPVQTGIFEVPVYGEKESSMSIAKYLDYIYFGGDGFGDIYIINVSDPSNPIYEGELDVNDWSPGIEVYEDNLYVAGYWGGFQIFDLEDPTNPIEVGYYPMAFAREIAVGSGKAFISGYVSMSGGGIEVFDITDLTNPQHVVTYEDWATDLQCVGDNLIYSSRPYLDIDAAIYLLDVSDLSNPVLKQTVDSVAANGIFYNDEYLLAIEDFQLKVFGDSTQVGYLEKPHDTQFVIDCYPNPANEQLRCRFNLSGSFHVSIEIYNLAGKCVMNFPPQTYPEGEHNFTTNIKSLYPGVYLIKVQCGEQNSMKKFIICR